MTNQSTTPAPKPNYLSLAGIALVISAAIGLAAFLDVGKFLGDALNWIEGLGSLGVLIFVLLYIGATIFFLPGSILTLGAGALFGVVWGSIYVSIASVSGATIAFLIGRYLARGWITKKIEGNQKLSAVDKAVGNEGWKIVLLTRLSPVFPFNLLNYFYGITKVKLLDYLLASWVGMLPGTVMYVYLGSVAGALTTSSGSREKTSAEWGLYGVGLLATVAVTIYVTKVARKALNEKVEIDPQ